MWPARDRGDPWSRVVTLMFVDQVRIIVAGGAGGNGCVSFRREKYVPRGGPDGGPGGDGGSVYVVSDRSLKALNFFRYRKTFVAERGRHGEGSGCDGRSGNDLVLKVPPGTVVLSEDKSTVLCDLVQERDRVLVASGGRGGPGNASFATSTHQAPREAEAGQPGEKVAIFLELKLIADVGIVGFPNAGKSTLIARISAARPRIADYPFTTLEPNLGVVELGDFRTFVVADIPGLLEGAHTGHGLGMKFLRHVERTRVLIHLVDAAEASGREPAHDLEVINSELEAYGAALVRKRQVVVANKIDAVSDRNRVGALAAHCDRAGIPFFAISAVTGEGIPALLETVWSLVQEAVPVPGDPRAAEEPAGRRN